MKKVIDIPDAIVERIQTADLLLQDIDPLCDAIINGTDYVEAEWAEVYKNYIWCWECSNCHQTPLYTSNDYRAFSDYCPSCGAKMKGGDE
jgi:Zn finger protein HypA/HybF involved in hydrogenase expression